MKTLIPLILLTVVGCATHAQPRAAIPVPPPPPDEDVIIVAQAPEPAKVRIAPGASAALPVKPLPPDHPDSPRGGVSVWSGPFKYGLSGSSSSSSRRTLVIP